MAIMELTDKYDVISIQLIYCSIHLIPKFEIVIDLKTTMSNQIPVNKYWELYINSYIDKHAYINCY